MKNRKEQSMRQEPPLVIDITLTRGLLALLALALVTATFLGTLACGQMDAAADTQAAPAAFAGKRKYYLTQSPFDGSEALTACAPGYHMASLWEILDPSNLEYNSALGRARADGGAGPPTFFGTWVRTGGPSSVSGDPGEANCAAWTTNDDSARGTLATLHRDWTDDNQDIHVWFVSDFTCNYKELVWCVED